MNTTTEIIHKEHFEHWLFSQPEEREFDFFSVQGCMNCAFIRETTNFPLFSVGGDTFTDQNFKTFPLPNWLSPLLALARRERNSTFNDNGDLEIWFTIADTKRAWLKLFPETEVNIQPAQAVKEVK